MFDNFQRFKPHFLIYTAMLCVSTSGALGRYVTTAPPLTIWYRALIGFLFLVLIIKLSGRSLRLKQKSDFGFILLSSVLMGAHWVTYFFSLKYSNVAIGMLSLFSYPVITTFLEPVFLKTKLNKVHVIFGIILMVGVGFLIPEYDIANNITMGVILGLISAICYALRNVLLKWRGAAYDGMVMMTLQTFIISLLLLPVALTYSHEQVSSNWMGLVALGILTTAIGHSLFISSFKYFSISKVSIISSMQPLFGITLAILFLNEVPDGRTFIGGMIIIGVVAIESLRIER